MSNRAFLWIAILVLPVLAGCQRIEHRIRHPLGYTATAHPAMAVEGTCR